MSPKCFVVMLGSALCAVSTVLCTTVVVVGAQGVELEDFVRVLGVFACVGFAGASLIGLVLMFSTANETETQCVVDEASDGE